MVAEIATLAFVFTVGFINDIFGRKWPFVIGMMIGAATIICSPIPTKLVWLYVLRTIGNVAFLPSTSSPFNVDYYYPEQMGKV